MTLGDADRPAPNDENIGEFGPARRVPNPPPGSAGNLTPGNTYKSKPWSFSGGTSVSNEVDSHETQAETTDGSLPIRNTPQHPHLAHRPTLTSLSPGQTAPSLDAPRPKIRVEYLWSVWLERGGLKRTAIVLAGVLIFVYGAAAIGYAVDEDPSTAPQSTYVGSHNVSKLAADQITATLLSNEPSFANILLSLTVKDATTEASLGELGVTLASKDIAEAAIKRRGRSFVLLRPLSWLADKTFAKHQVRLSFSVDEEQFRHVIDSNLADEITRIAEPSFDYVDGELVVVPPTPGIAIDTNGIGELIAEAMAEPSLDSYEISVPTIVKEPTITSTQAAALIPEADRATDNPIAITFLERSIHVEPEILKTWLGTARNAQGSIDWVIDSERSNSYLNSRLIDQFESHESPRFTVIDNAPVLVPPATKMECCADNSGAAIKAGLLSPPQTVTPVPPTTFDTMPAECTVPGRKLITTTQADVKIRRASLNPRLIAQDPQHQQLGSLGIVEEIASCTTGFEPESEPGRVANIHRIADIMRGEVIEPGSELSINDVVGERTTSKGFYPAGAIVDGRLTYANVGGGISQFVTTFFVASFFGGLDLVKYQTHSLYLDRYPYGLDATISWGGPEQIVRNQTDYGVLVWTDYTDTSVTVTLYSTKHIATEALHQREYDRGVACTVVETGRIRNGKTDSKPVVAVYRKREGYDCEGNPTAAQRELLERDANPNSESQP